MWITHAERLLEPDELCNALAVELGSRDFNAGNIPSIKTLVNCCQGLITLDQEGSTVRLIHFTLKEYLSAHPHVFSRPHSVMAEVCLTYLNLQQVKAIPLSDSPDLSAIPFLEYSSLYWGVHAKKELSAYSKSLALQLLQEYDGHISIQILNFGDEWELMYSGSRSPFSGLHWAAFFGIVEIVASLIEMGCCDTNGEDFMGYTRLARAAWKGHEEVVKVLLGWEEVNPDEPDDMGRTPLSHAASNGYGGVVKVLLADGGIYPNKPDYEGRTPLSYAARNRRKECVNILFRNLINNF